MRYHLPIRAWFLAIFVWIPAQAFSETIPWSEIGAKATADYAGDGLAISEKAAGTEINCVFQKLKGEATPNGLWIESTSDGGGRFLVKASAFGRTTFPASLGKFPDTGNIEIHGKLVRYIRHGVTEEYSSSVDGIRQDFLIDQRPAGTGELSVELDLQGATAEPSPTGVRLTLQGSDRKLSYHRLLVTDATGKELPARMEVIADHENKIALNVDDTDAVYPIRIDPTFSDENWISLGGLPGTENVVFATVVDEAGNLYIGGAFNIAGDVFANRIARWDGTTWTPLGTGVNNTVLALAFADGELYAAGDFTTAGGIAANRIARWDGTAWSPLGTGMNSSIRALTISGGELYAGGDFTTAGGVAASRIARWDGTAWSPLGSGMSDSVRTLTTSGGELYAGGGFSTAGGITVNRIARWDGTTWSPLGSGMDNTVIALAIAGGELYAGGDFTTAGGIAANRIARWDGTSWSPLGSGMPSSVRALTVLGGELYAGGFFTTAGGVAANNIARWDGANWFPLGSGTGDLVTALAIFDGELYTSGFFTSAGGVSANYISRWDGTTWSAVSAGFNDSVRALAIEGGDLYVAGSFTAAGGIAANRVAKWDGTTWSPLGSGVSSTVNALAISGGQLSVGGAFSTAGGITVNNIARWDGASWSALGSGMNSSVTTLAISGGELYAGGSFTTAGGVPANRVARWNGTTWSPLGTGMNNFVLALSFSGGELYAGGTFSTAGGIAASRIAKWDGTSWSPLGSGVNSTVNALTIGDGELYAGGAFTGAGGISANGIARWNGTTWSRLGTGMNGTVRALAFSEGELYAGGSFGIVGGMAISRIAKWDGTSWSPLGSGITNTVHALTIAGGELYAGGEFTTAGGKVSAYLAQAQLGDPNSPPSADSRSFSTNKNTPVEVTFSGTDPDDDPLSFFLATDPSHGSLTGTAPNPIYTPNTGYVGEDSFTYFVSDGTAVSAPATITIQVNEPPQPADYIYTTANGEITITGYTGAGGAITIPSLIDGFPVKFIGTEAFENNTNITSVTIPGSVTTIGTSAFQGCTGLTSVTLQPGLTSIGNSAFRSCIQLASINIPLGVTIIGNNAFQSCIGLASVSFPNTLTTISNSAFTSCTSLTTISIPDSVTSIGISAFNSCTGLASVTLPAGLTSISSAVFHSCHALTSINIPATVTVIGISAFRDCIALTEISLPESITSLGGNAFFGCTALTRVNLADLSVIQGGTFQSCTALKEIVFPASITSIANSAFQGCSAMTRVYFLGDAPTLGTGVFGGTAVGFTVYFVVEDGGFTTPTWLGHPAEVFEAASISSQPIGYEIFAGSLAIVDVSTSGNPYPSFQWYLGESGDTSNPIPGATDEFHIIPELFSTTSYWVRLSNFPDVFLDSETGTITVTEAPPQIPDLIVNISAPPDATAGVSFEYTIIASNVGNQTASGISLNFTVPSGLTVQNVNVAGGFTRVGTGTSPMTFTGGSLGIGASAILTVTVTAVTPATYSTVSGSSTIDPSGSIVESDETNNGSPQIINTLVASGNNANLSNMFLNSSSLSPGFNQLTTSYTATVPNSTSLINLTPTAAASGATIRVNGNTVASGTPSNSINLNVGGNIIEVVVTAPDLITTKTYSINILRSEPPSIATNPATAITSSGATLNGTVDPNGSAIVFFEYGTTLSYGSFTPAQFFSGNDSTPFQSTLSGIQGNTTIHYRAVAIQGTTTVTGLDRSFTTLPTPAIVVTGNPVVTSGTAATLVGAINTQGQQAEVFFEYGTTTAYGNSTTPRIIPAGSGLQDVLEEITGLIPNTFYHVRLVASSPITVEGNDILFQQKVVDGSGTGSPTAVPSATTGGVVDVQDDAATLKGTVNANGGTTTAYFQYGTTPSYGQISEIQPIGNDTLDAEVSINTTNLLPGTRYYYRLVAENSLGLSTPDTGSFFDTNFTPPIVSTGNAEALTTTSVRVSGTVNANNADTDVEIIFGTNPNSLSDGIATTPALVTGNEQTAVSADLTNLLQSVTYYYRVRAVNSGGTTLGTLRTFRVSTLSGLLQIFPDELDPSDHAGSLQVNITPSGIGAGWRLAGEQAWRLPGETITGLTSGDRIVEYRAISGFLPPSSETITVVSGDPTLVLSRTYTASGATGSGSLTVNLKPDTIADPSRPVAERTQWRLLGETNSDWKNSGTTVTGLPPGNHVVECKPIAGRSTPPAASVVISDGATTSLILTYYEADPAIGDLPEVLDFDPVRDDESLPYAYVGQIRSDAGSSTGFVVRPRVVATVAHAVFDDGTLASATGLQWLFQRHRGVHEPTPMIPRGFYTLTGYAAQRAIDNSPGISTPESQHLDAAAMYFAANAGRSGFSGYLASDLDDNEFLLSSSLKTLVGYPIENIDADDKDRMHATPPENITFTLPTGTTRTFTTDEIRSTGGGSGGPLCVLASNGKFFPAGIYLGGTQQTIIRAIDSDVASLFGFAEVSGNSAGGGGRGSITSSESSPVGTPSLGSLKVFIEPAGARNAGAGWRISSGSYLTSGAQLNNLAPNTYGIEFPTVSGFQPPATPSVDIVAGELNTVTFTYEIIIPPPVINSAASVTVNKGDELVYQITATNTPTLFTLSGLLPLGTVFDPATGRITGIVQVAGKFPVVVGVSNSGGTDTRNVEIISLPIIEPQLINAPYLETFEYQILSSEAGDAVVYGATNLPPGLTLDTSTGLVSGTPITPGTYVSTISVTVSGATKSSTLTFEITGTLPEITTQPAASTSIEYGENVVLTIATTGLPTPTIQWYIGNSGDITQPITGATNTTFVSPSLTASTAYWARVTNLSGSVDSETSAVVILPSTNANLNFLSLNATTISPAFTPNGTTYTASVPNSVASIRLTPNTAVPVSTLAINNIPSPINSLSEPVALVEGANPISILVTAQDGTTTKQYTVTVTRAPAPDVQTLGSDTINDITATVRGSVNPRGSGTVFFEYGPTTAYGSRTSSQQISGTNAIPVSAVINGLSGNRDYHYRVALDDGGTPVYGQDMTFRTSPDRPQVVTGNAAAVSETGATLIGIVNPRGSQTNVRFEYGTNPNSLNSVTPLQPIGSGIRVVEVTAPITGLSEGLVYYFRTVAESVAFAQPVYGEIVQFTAVTSPETGDGRADGPPIVVPGSETATTITTNSAVLEATINPNDGSTLVHFEYGTTLAYGFQSDSFRIGNGTQNALVTIPVANLEIGETYFFRVVAENAEGVINGTGTSFTTSFETPTVTTGEAVPISSRSARVNGTVNANGTTRDVYFRYGTDGVTFPFSVRAFQQTVDGNLETPVFVDLANLDEGVTYFYKLVATDVGEVEGTEGLALPLNASVLLGLVRELPTDLETSQRQGQVTVNLLPEGTGSWRFSGEQTWRASGETATALTEGDRTIEFRPVTGFIQPPAELITLSDGDPSLILERDYYESAATATGSLQVTLFPTSISNTSIVEADRAQWRLANDTDTTWKNSNDTIDELPEGTYLVETKTVSGFDKPVLTSVTIADDEESNLSITYLQAGTTPAISPEIVSFETGQNQPELPFVHVGQVRSESGSYSGFVVKSKVVATAAQAVFDEATLASVTQMQWLHQRDSSSHEPKPMEPRGSYLFLGYDAQRMTENTPGTFSTDSKNLNVAALFFFTNAGREGFSGFLASDENDNEFLTSTEPKILAGYPVNGSAPGRMHATAPNIAAFTWEQGKTFSSTTIRGLGGMTGGPLCVQHEGGAYYPAAIHVGDTDKGFVRAIDRDIIDIFTRAEVSGNGGDNNTDGGITLTSVAGNLSTTQPGSIRLNILPAAAVSLGAAWRILPESSLRQSGGQKTSLTPGSYSIEMRTITGYNTPTLQSVVVNGGQLTTYTYTYTEITSNTPLNQWRFDNFGTLINSGDAADNFDFDKDGVKNIDEFTTGTNPKNGSDFFAIATSVKSGDTFTLTCIGKTNRSYTLLRSTDLSGTWTRLESRGSLSDGVTITLTDTSAPNNTAFYRIEVNLSETTSTVPLDLWRFENFGTYDNSGNTADNSDFDSDGSTNADEFTTGTDPKDLTDVFKMTSAEKSGNTFTTTCPGKSGRTYTLLRNTTLSGEWTRLGSQGPLANDANVTLTDPSAPPDKSFYIIEVSIP